MSGNVEKLWARSVYAPIPVRNAFEVTVQRLAQGIRLGVLVAGDRLPPER
ncbi:GntR family transcriptional regulator, partial [Pseudomonas sp. FW305-33]